MDHISSGVLRLLGRACTFDDLEELSNIGAETHRRFFHVFVRRGAEQLKLETAPYECGDKDVLDQVERLYAANGFPGCVGSTDCVSSCLWHLCICHHQLPFTPSHVAGFRSTSHGPAVRSPTSIDILARRGSRP